MNIPAFTSEDQRYDYPLTKDSVVIDAGCFEGTFAAKISEKYRARVFAFEPVAHFFERCYRRFKNPSEGVRVFNYAVGGMHGTIEGRECGDGSGLYAKNGGHWSAGMITMDEALGLIGEPHVDLLKINIEGSEFDLLDDILAKGLAPHFTDIQVQFHDIVPDAVARREAIKVGLSQTHHLTFCTPFVWENWRINP